MPAKGWKKNAEGQYVPVMSEMPQSDNEPVSIDSVLLPKARVTRLAKSVLENNEILSKEGLSVIQRSSTVFINYIHHYARQLSMDANRKTVNEDDVLFAIQQCEFQGFLPTLRQELDLFKERKASKKSNSGETEGEQQESEIQPEQSLQAEEVEELEAEKPEAQEPGAQEPEAEEPEAEEPEAKRTKMDQTQATRAPQSEMTSDVHNNSAEDGSDQ